MPEAPALPTEPSQVDPAWLGAALAERFPDVRVASVEVTAVGQGTNTNASLRVRYDAPCELPERLFLKLPPLDPARREAVNRTGMGRREALFYQTLAERVPMRVPRPYVARFDETSGAFALVIEDLEATGCTFPDAVAGLRVGQAERAMGDFAALHVRYEDAARRRREAGWVERMPGGSDFGTTLLKLGLDHHRDRLTDAFAELATLYIRRQAQLEEVWSRGSVTVLQGDGHIGNLFEERDAGKRPGFFDWGLIQLGTPMRDVGYFLIMALSPENRREHERDLIGRYLEARRELGGAAIAADEAWTQHRVHASYAVPAACPLVTFPAGAPPSSAAFLERAEIAIEDLEARAALREAAGI